MSESDYPTDEGPEPIDEMFGAEPANEEDDDDPSDLELQVEALNDKLLRMAAELENTRRRAAREKADASKFAIANFARDLLGVSDNFERALSAANSTDETAASPAYSALMDGLQMTAKELLTVLDRHGVRRISPQGEKFDPNLHQAVANVPSDTIEKGCVVDVAQVGFTIDERVLRAAMVTVSAGSDGSSQAGSQVDEEA